MIPLLLAMQKIAKPGDGLHADLLRMIRRQVSDGDGRPSFAHNSSSTADNPSRGTKMLAEDRAEAPAA